MVLTFKGFFEETAGPAAFDFHHILWRTRRDKFTAAISAFRAKIEDPVSCFDDIEVVFDHNDGVAIVHQFVEHFEKLSDVFKVKPGCGFVENVERSTGGALRQLFGEFDPLGFTARKCVRLLPDFEIGKPYPVEGFHFAPDTRYS